MTRLQNIAGFRTVQAFVSHKVACFDKDRTFQTLFSLMFSERENVIFEQSDGYRITKTTYGECCQSIIERAHGLMQRLDARKGSYIGLSMDNSPLWIELCWAILMAGYRPLLLNRHLPHETLNDLLETYCVACVISDGVSFCVPTVQAGEIAKVKESVLPQTPWGDEIVFMSSGSTGQVKLCAYHAENFYYQIRNSCDIVLHCPQIAAHYEGEIKLLTLLPFYHIFGFIAVYLWFGFFSRTFVFLKDMNPQTIQNTVLKHKVTHFFAVPLVWETVYRTAMRTIRAQGEKQRTKFARGVHLANKHALGQKIVHRGMRVVREKIFGESIRFLISGGGAISKEALAFFNGIGYFFVNGYGMTEAGITSVEISTNPAERVLGAVGLPFPHIEYNITENGRLQVRGKSMAHRILVNGQPAELTREGWLDTNDLAAFMHKRFFLQGRADDIIVTESGKNLNPELIEGLLHVDGVADCCLVCVEQMPTLVLSVPHCFAAQKAQRVLKDTEEALRRLELGSEIRRILLTPEALIEEGDFKVSRRKLASRIAQGKLSVMDPKNLAQDAARIADALEKQICAAFAEVLQLDVSAISPHMHFFTDLNGSSLDYFLLSDLLMQKFGLDIKNTEAGGLYTVEAIYQAILQG